MIKLTDAQYEQIKGHRAFQIFGGNAYAPGLAISKAAAEQKLRSRPDLRAAFGIEEEPKK